MAELPESEIYYEAGLILDISYLATVQKERVVTLTKNVVI